MKKIISIFISFIISLSFISCGSSSSSSSTTLHTGQSLALSKDAPVCSSKENVDKMINFVKEKNSSGQDQMLARGEAKILPKGTQVNVISISATLVVEVETQDGKKWFAPDSAFK